MAWVQVQQRKVWGRPSGKVRVGVNDVRGTRLVNIILAEDVLAAAGIAIGDALILERGTGGNDGWLRISRGTGETRIVGKLPNTASGIVRFTLPAELPLPVSTSTATDDWETGKGSVTLRLPDAVLEGRAAPVAKVKGKPRPAIPLVEPKPAPKPVAVAASKQDAALSLLRSRVSTDQVVRETGLSPREVVALAEREKTERLAGAA